MQKIYFVVVGKIKESFYREAVAEYVKRLSRFAKVEVKELPEGFILVERMIGGVPRKGLMVLVDLEEYEFDITKSTKKDLAVIKKQVRERIAMRRILDEDDGQIIDFM